jgi:hypothetical protein
MLEIFLWIALYRKLATIAESKGRGRTWGWLGVGFWLGGEVMGAVVGGLVGMEGFGVYGVALLFAAIGAGVSYAIVNSLPANAGFA